MANFCSCIIAGRLTRDVSMAYTASNLVVVNGCIASSRKYKDKEDTVFLDFAAFGKTAEIINQYANAKGAGLLLSGYLRTEKWTGKDGSPKSKISLVVNEMQLLDSKKSAVPADARGPKADSAGQGSGGDDDIPF